ncbi:FimD/PapC C-terminal domain-containing protein [Ectopseudomonas mendocina]|uniref:FimD/PapC C-terminal domain-containing protein n=1 Tax=Ectopseudomonas mendocina TaxID=300 RepID=A0ABZ2RLQ7_ECTME
MEVNSGRYAPVGWDGQVYFEELGSKNRLIITQPDGRTCQADFLLSIKTPNITRIGPLPCIFTTGVAP